MVNKDSLLTTISLIAHSFKLPEQFNSSIFETLLYAITIPERYFF